MVQTSEHNKRFVKLQVKIGGMQCSFCVESINKAFRRVGGVSEVSVNLAHEKALVQYDPKRLNPRQLKDTLVAMGYTWRDTEKVRSFEEEEAELWAARQRFLNDSKLMSIMDQYRDQIYEIALASLSLQRFGL